MLVKLPVIPLPPPPGITGSFRGERLASTMGRTDGLLSVKCVLGSLSPFVHWSFVAPNIFGVRMIMVPPHARFAVVPFAFCSGFAGGLNGTLSFHVGGVSVVGTKHISPPLERDNAWLHATAHRAAVESPEPVAAIRRKLGGDQALPKVSSPMSGLKRSTWAKCLGSAGRLQCGPTKSDLVWTGTKVKNAS